jgi:hypothetical protein
MVNELINTIFDAIDKEGKYTNQYHFNDINKYIVSCNDKEFLEDINDYLNYHLTYIHEDNSKSDFLSSFNITILIDNALFCKFKDDYLREHYSCYQEKSGAIVINRNNQTIFLATEQLKNLNLIQDIYCIIRRNNLLALQRDGVLLLHGASFQINKEATIILGNKGFGKSFIADYSIYYLGASYIAADQTLIFTRDNKKPVCAGNITSYRLDMEQDIILKNFEIDIYINKYRNEPQRYFGGKLNVPPMFFKNILDRTIVPQSILKNIIFICEDICGYEAVSAQKAIEQVNGYLLDDGVNNLNSNGNRILDLIYKYCNFYTIEKFASLNIVSNLMQKIKENSNEIN